MFVLIVALCTTSLGWLVLRVCTLWAIPIQELKKILNIVVPSAPVASITNVTTDSVGLRWQCQRASEQKPASVEEEMPSPATSISGISHYIIYINGIELAKVPGTESSVVLRDLNANTHYQIDIVAFNNLNFRSKSFSVFVRTNDFPSNTIDKLLNVDDSDNNHHQMVLMCDPKLLYEDHNLDEKLKTQIQSVRSRSNTVESASVVSLPGLNLPKPSEMTNLDDLKYHLARAQEDWSNTELQRKKTLQDFLQQVDEYLSTLAHLNERMRIGDKNRSAAKLELSYLEDSKLKLRVRIEKLKLSLAAMHLETEKKELQIAEFEQIILGKQQLCASIGAGQELEFASYEAHALAILLQIEDLIRSNLVLEDAIKVRTATRKQSEQLKLRLGPVFAELDRSTNNEGALERDGNDALNVLKAEHAEWYLRINDLITRTAQEMAMSIAKRLNLQNAIRKNTELISHYTLELEALKLQQQETASGFLRSTYMPQNDASSFGGSSVNILNPFSSLNLRHQQSIPSLADSASGSGWVGVNGNGNGTVNGNGNVNGNVNGSVNPNVNVNVNPNVNPNPNVNATPSNSLFENNNGSTSNIAPMLPIELLDDEDELFSTQSHNTANTQNASNNQATSSVMRPSESYFSANGNPFGGISDHVGSASSDFLYPNYASLLETGSVQLSVHGSTSPSYHVASSPPMSASTTHRSIGSNGGNTFPGLSLANDNYIPYSAAGLSRDLLSLAHTSNPKDSNKRRLSFGFFNKSGNDSPGSASNTMLSSSVTSSRFFAKKKQPKSPEQHTIEPTFTHPLGGTLSPGLDSLSVHEVSTRDRSGSFHSHNSIWNNAINSGSNFQGILGTPIPHRQSFEMGSSPGSVSSPGQLRPISIPIKFDPTPTPVILTTDSADVLENSLSTTDHFSDTQIRKFSTRSSNLSKQDSVQSDLSLQLSNLQHPGTINTSSNILDVPLSPSKFKKLFNSSTSPSKHEKTGSIHSNSMSMSGESEFGTDLAQPAGGRKLFKKNRKGSISTTASVSTANSSSLVTGALSSANTSSALAKDVVGSVVNVTSSGLASVGPGSSTASKKLKNFFTGKRKVHDDNGKTDTEETIEEASDESSGKGK